jgi:hypothetical protein
MDERGTCWVCVVAGSRFFEQRLVCKNGAYSDVGTVHIRREFLVIGIICSRL